MSGTHLQVETRIGEKPGCLFSAPSWRCCSLDRDCRPWLWVLGHASSPPPPPHTHPGCSLLLPLWPALGGNGSVRLLGPGYHHPLWVLSSALRSVYGLFLKLFLVKPFGSAFCFCQHSDVAPLFCTACTWMQFRFVARRSFIGAYVLEPGCHFIFWIIPKHPLVAWQYAHLARLDNISQNSGPCIFLVREGGGGSYRDI